MVVDQDFSIKHARHCFIREITLPVFIASPGNHVERAGFLRRVGDEASARKEQEAEAEGARDDDVLGLSEVEAFFAARVIPIASSG